MNGAIGGPIASVLSQPFCRNIQLPLSSSIHASISTGLVSLCFLLLVQCLALSSGAPSLNDVITARDVERLSQVLRKATLSDLATAHSIAAGLGLVAKGSGETKTVSRC